MIDLVNHRDRWSPEEADAYEAKKNHAIGTDCEWGLLMLDEPCVAEGLGRRDGLRMCSKHMGQWDAGEPS